jgi:hypothetical protein
MDGLVQRRRSAAAWSIVLVLLSVAAGGCSILSTALWVIKDGKTFPAEYKGLKNKKVAVVCRGPMRLQFGHEAIAPPLIAAQVSHLLQSELNKKIEVIEPQRVARYMDETQWETFEEVGKAVGAEMVIGIDLEVFSLASGRSLHQGEASVRVEVFDLAEGKRAWSTNIDVKFPPTIQGVPAQEMSEERFLQAFIRYVAEQVGRRFYDHDPTLDVASTGLTR